MYLGQCETQHFDAGHPGSVAGSPLAETAPVRQRRKIGRIGLAHCHFTAMREISFTANAATVHVFIPLCGSLTVRSQVETRVVDATTILLAARGEALACCGQPGASALILHCSRTCVQIAAAETIGDPRRLTPASFEIARVDVRQLDQTLERIALRHNTLNIDDESALERALLMGLVAGLVSSGQAVEAFPVAASVQRVIDYVRSDPQADCSDRELTRVAGITLPPLQRNFRECLGKPLARFVQEARLDLAHERLTGVRESRSIAQLATDLGFSTASIFARAYLRRFGEIPSQTRARAVRG